MDLIFLINKGIMLILLVRNYKKEEEWNNK